MSWGGVAFKLQHLVSMLVLRPTFFPLFSFSQKWFWIAIVLFAHYLPYSGIIHAKRFKSFPKKKKKVPMTFPVCGFTFPFCDIPA
jgi:hypothetical protein